MTTQHQTMRAALVEKAGYGTARTVSAFRPSSGPRHSLASASSSAGAGVEVRNCSEDNLSPYSASFSSRFRPYTT